MSTPIFKTVVSRANTKLANAYEALTDKTAPIDVLNGTVDVFALTVTERKGLVEGPKADIFVGDKLAFRNASIRALMAWSYKFNNHFDENPLARTITLDKSIDVSATQLILKATITTSGMCGEKIQVVRKGATLEQLSLIYQAGLALGMDDRVKYHGNFLKRLISEDLISYEALETIIKAIPATDSVFQHLAKDLAYRRFKRAIGDAEEFEAWLQKHATLKDAMNEADASHQAVRKANRKAASVAKSKEEKRQRVAEEKRQEAEDKREEAAYWSRVKALKAKINASKGAIVSLTQEEAELRRELGI